MKYMTTHKNYIVCLLLILAVVLAYALCVALIDTPVTYAENKITFALSEKTVHRGQTFVVDLTVTDNTGLTSAKLSVDYDASVFTLIEVERGEGLPTMTMTTTNVGTSTGYNVHPFNVLFDATRPTTAEGVLARFVFESNINASIGDYVISLNYDASNTNSAYNTPVALNTDNGLVHLQTGEFAARYLDWNDDVLYYRDYNDDGEVPVYQGVTPVRDEDDCYTYKFKEWKGDPTDDVNVLQYRAQYEKTPKVYSVFYYVDGLAEGETPDGDFDNNDLYYWSEFAYGSDVDLSLNPKKENYTFEGWFADEGLSKGLNSLSMPSQNTRVYGYMRYNVRTEDIPKIRLSYTELSETEIEVNVRMAYNPGINAMVLTLQYNKEDIKFARFTRGLALETMQFDTTNLDAEGGLAQDNFKFYWESAENVTDTGNILSLVFDISNSENGVFPVTFTYDETHDATYVENDENKTIWYTRLDIAGTSVPVGEKFHWNEPVGEIFIDVKSVDGKPLDVELVVKRADVKINESSLTRLQNLDLEIKNIYSINLMRNGEVVTSDTDLSVGIGLTKEELASKNLALYHLGENGELIEYNFTVEDASALFDMHNIEYWVIAGDVTKPEIDKEWTGETIRAVLLPSLLAVTTMAYALILLAQNNKNKKIRNPKGNGGKE